MPEIENILAVGIQVVIRLGDGFDLVVLAAEIAADDPDASGLALSVAEVQAAVDRSPIGLAARRQFAASLTTVEGSYPVLAVPSDKPPCPTLSNIRG